MKKRLKKPTLAEKTLDLVQNRPRSVTLADLAKRVRVSVSWMGKFAQGLIPNPGVNTVQKIYDALSEKPLEY